MRVFEPMTGQVLCGRTYENNDILKAVGSECVTCVGVIVVRNNTGKSYPVVP